MPRKDKEPRTAEEAYKAERAYKEKHRWGKPVGDTIPLAKAFQEWLHSSGGEKKYLEADLLLRWEEIAGEEISKYAKAVRLDRNRLIIQVEDSVWRHQLMFMREELMKKLNAATGQQVIKEIVFTG